GSKPYGSVCEKGVLLVDQWDLLAPGLLDDLLGNVPRNLGVAVELHRVHRATLGLGPQVADVAEHLRQRHQCANDLDASRVRHGLDHSTTGVEVADDVAHVLLGRTHLDVHDGLEEHGVRLADTLLEHHRAGDLEGHLRGVDLVVSTVEQDRLDTHHGVAGEDTVLHGVLDARVHARDVLARDAATG